jgi:hypothetical protein
MKVLPEAWRLGVHSYWVGAVVNLSFMAIAYGISLVRRGPPRDLTGLTVWTMPRADGEGGAPGGGR